LMKVEVVPFEVRSPAGLGDVFSAMASQQVEAVSITDTGMLNVNIKTAADLAAKKRLPSIGISELAEAGGLIGFGVNITEQYRRVAYFVDRIIKGAKPADIPVEQPTRFELIVNLRTAKMLGIKIAPALLQRADKVIE
jgi:putative ABC transport system substrate-binding protein